MTPSINRFTSGNVLDEVTRKQNHRYTPRNHSNPTNKMLGILPVFSGKEEKGTCELYLDKHQGTVISIFLKIDTGGPTHTKNRKNAERRWANRLSCHFPDRSGRFSIRWHRKRGTRQDHTKFSIIYFVDIFGFCIMGNHFHLLVNMYPGQDFSDEEIQNDSSFFTGITRTSRKIKSNLTGQSGRISPNL